MLLIRSFSSRRSLALWRRYQKCVHFLHAHLSDGTLCYCPVTPAVAVKAILQVTARKWYLLIRLWTIQIP